MLIRLEEMNEHDRSGSGYDETTIIKAVGEVIGVDRGMRILKFQPFCASLYFVNDDDDVLLCAGTWVQLENRICKNAQRIV